VWNVCGMCVSIYSEDRLPYLIIIRLEAEFLGGMCVESLECVWNVC
jgi:hypothetical protein